MTQALALFAEAYWTPAEARVLYEPPPVPGDVWAEANIVLPRVKNPEPGPLNLDRSPYLRDILHTMTQPHVREGVIMAGNQLGKSMVAHILAGYWAERAVGSILIVMPDEKMSGRAVREKIRPLWEASPALAALAAGVKEPYRVDEFQFHNQVSLYLAWTTAAKLSMITAPIIIFDETDKYPHLVGKEGDVFGLGNARRRVYPYTYKTLKISTPTTSVGPIATALREEPDEVRRFHLCCPRCGEFQPARFAQIKWPDDVRDPRIILRERLAWYQCAGCEARLDDTQRDAAVRLGEWQPCLRGVFSTDAKERAEAEALPQPQPLDEPRTVGWQIPAMLSHFVPLSASAAEFLKTLGATNRKAALMKFANQEEGLPYDELVKMEAPGEEALLRFRDPELPAQTVPEWADFLIASFDMQQVGFWFEVWAVEKHPQHPRKALIHYGRLATWDDLETLAFEGAYPIRGEPGSLGIWRAGIDTGGTKEEGAKLSRTQEVYLWLRAKGRGKVFGMKGEGRREGQPKVRLSVHDRGAPGAKPKSAAAAKRKGLVLWLVDSPRFKDDIFAELSATLLCPALECSTETDRWAVGERGGLCPACGADIPHSRPTVVLHADVGSDWAKQMLAEAKHRQKDGSFEWVREKPDNHYLDCTVNAWALISPEAGGVLKAPRRPRGAGPASPRHPAAVPPGQRSPRFTFR